MNLLQILQDDYQRFPDDQTYGLYAEDVYFKDPLNEFRGRDRYQQMIGFIKTWFLNVQMDLHTIQRNGNLIRTDWTLSWNTPLPWKPHISISGWSELTVNGDDLIVSHIDYWHCSRLDVLKQHFR
ncbi:DUF2358 domain-containing protein [Phormidesmis priestleyi ULC007]|uniref:DUF2358 domain-containing protein n=1 Tax=Phormidesmis priestleyi ULC007 TaxID=1920490 RepID=A0A2T1D775_9CYAN|nr:DUF2358 domain-containing protein [Phormidesmis priestleyi]PSB16296.1 DUF2358 domain-containing protein [Phormidesmis priestleyi ULC007]PZO47004.1 MAG: DUF2358 domain-containing protein [Phormidesmis priestleyi]